jgi:hypothetical protein
MGAHYFYTRLVWEYTGVCVSTSGLLFFVSAKHKCALIYVDVDGDNCPNSHLGVNASYVM